MRREDGAFVALVLAGFAYALWPPGPGLRLWWLAAWVAVVVLAFLAVRAGRTVQSQAAPMPRTAADDWNVHLAHDFRTPLMRLRLQIEQLAAADAGLAPERLAALEAELLRLEHLVEDFIDLALSPSGSMQLKPEPIDLAGLLTAAVTRLEPVFAAAERDLRLRLCVVPKVFVDRARLERVLDNLFSNALRYAEGEGGVVLTLEQDGPLWVRVAVSNPSAAPTEPLQALLEPFVRGASGSAQRGFGLGLAVAERLTRLMGGKLRLRHENGRFEASVAFVRLPMEG